MKRKGKEGKKLEGNGRNCGKREEIMEKSWKRNEVKRSDRKRVRR